jgi:hypothetical protein
MRWGWSPHSARHAFHLKERRLSGLAGRGADHTGRASLPGFHILPALIGNQFYAAAYDVKKEVVIKLIGSC